jgi:DUF438 domain-containing protein
MIFRDTRILYFTEGRTPTEEDYAEARKLSANVGFRNRNLWKESDAPEMDVRAVAGHVPTGAGKRYIIVKSKADMDRIDARIAAGEEVGPVIEEPELRVPSWKSNT